MIDEYTANVMLYAIISSVVTAVLLVGVFFFAVWPQAQYCYQANENLSAVALYNVAANISTPQEAFQHYMLNQSWGSP